MPGSAPSIAVQVLINLLSRNPQTFKDNQNNLDRQSNLDKSQDYIGQGQNLHQSWEFYNFIGEEHR